MSRGSLNNRLHPRGMPSLLVLLAALASCSALAPKLEPPKVEVAAVRFAGGGTLPLC